MGKNQKGKRFGKRNYHVNSADVEGNFEKDFDVGEENSWFEDGWAYPNGHGNNTYDYYDDYGENEEFVEFENENWEVNQSTQKKGNGKSKGFGKGKSRGKPLNTGKIMKKLEIKAGIKEKEKEKARAKERKVENEKESPGKSRYT